MARFRAAASILGPFAAISAAIGSALADLIVGYSLYMPATFLIKGLMGLISGFRAPAQPAHALVHDGCLISSL
jgi:uncharacterized membrane protein